jgi:hypothetical protein
MLQQIDSNDLATVAGGQTPGQINQPQAVAAGVQGAQTGATVGGAAGAGLGAALAPTGLAPAGAAVGAQAGRVAGAAVGGVVGYGNNVAQQIRGWFR